MKKVTNFISEYIDIKSVLIFVGLTAGFYYFNTFYIAITDRQGLIYSPFLEKYLNYISWIRVSILQVAKLVASAAGTDCYVLNDHTLKAYGGAYIMLAYVCIGYGITGFWVAFIIAQADTLKRKFLWSFFGTIALWFINCCRIGILLVAFDKRWQMNKYADHHTMFNIATYILIFLMLFLYHKSRKSEKVERVQEMVVSVN